MKMARAHHLTMTNGNETSALLLVFILTDAIPRTPTASAKPSDFGGNQKRSPAVTRCTNKRTLGSKYYIS